MEQSNYEEVIYLAEGRRSCSLTLLDNNTANININVENFSHPRSRINSIPQYYIYHKYPSNTTSMEDVETLLIDFTGHTYNTVNNFYEVKIRHL